MSGQLLRYNPQNRTYVKQGQDGKFQPKVLTNSYRTQPNGLTVQGEKIGAPMVLTKKSSSNG